VPARIASFREIDWDSMGLNYALIYSPNALSGAPHSYVATIALPAPGPAIEAALNKTVVQSFPSVSLIPVRDLITTLADMLRQISSAIRAAASVVIAAGVAVLVGAIAAARQARTYDSVLLKLLGATRAQILAAQAMEYALLALIVSGVALGVAASGGWYVVTRLLDLEWSPDWAVVLATIGAGAALTLALGLLGALPALAARPARALREL
jgi:putative ABC transport system permease protein